MKMKIYQAYKLCIASELPLPKLLETEGEPDVIIRLGKIDNNFEVRHDGSNNCRGSLPGIGRFLIQDGREILVSPEPGIEADRLGMILIGPALCIILRQRGFLVLHASCVEINNLAVAFMGASGCGKSTMGAAFYTRGYRILTDDVMPIKITANSVTAFPSYPYFKLFPEALTSLGENPKKLSSVTEKSLKLSYTFASNFQEHPLKLQRIYVLDKGDKHKIKMMKSQDIFVELVRHTRAINLMNSSESMTEHLHFCSQLIQKVRFSQFTRKPSLTDLPKLVKMVEDDLEKIDNNILTS